MGRYRGWVTGKQDQRTALFWFDRLEQVSDAPAMNACTLTVWLFYHKAAAFSPIRAAAEVIPSNAGGLLIYFGEGGPRGYRLCNNGRIGCADNLLVCNDIFSAGAQKIIQGVGARAFRLKSAVLDDAPLQIARDLSNELANRGGAVRSTRSDLLSPAFA